MPANYNCLLFDLDGTLFDFGAAEREAIAATLQAFSLPGDEETQNKFSAINAELWAQLEQGIIKKDRLVVERFARLLAELGANGDAVKMNNDFMTKLSGAAHCIPGAEELLAELSEFATLAAVTNGIQRVAMARLEKSGLLPYFDGVFVSEKVGAAKPNPKIFNTALNRLGIKNKAKTLVIGDSLAADIKGGAAAGLDTCWCNFSNIENTTAITPTYTVQSFTQLKIAAVGEEELTLAATREKRHTV